ncbi:MAG TPA: hypothetical protein VMW27_25935 [Thermoanaerobaculia bacterium]|nr:hypothetical protein [Thermoanaerobaculia bacterium]
MATLAAVPAQPVPFEPGLWRIDAAAGRVEEHLGRRSLFLKGGIATVAGARFADGAIEFDVAFSGERGFMGGVWRVQDAKNYEELYLRPHQSGNQDATQYTPVFRDVSGWQLYHGERYTVPVVHRFDAWTRVRIVFAGSRAEVYVGGMEEPVLCIDELKRGVEPGGVGVSVSDFAPAHFSNFSFTLDAPTLRGKPRVPELVPDGAILSWQVSDAFPERRLDGKYSLTPEDLAARRWTRLDTERSGLANLARLQGIELIKNTVFARQVLRSDREQTKRLDFGFSDRVRVYLNGRLLFRGDDVYQSRDYRFLGSIGYFDALYLPLAKGDNELLLAVTEDEPQGGWGVQAKLEDLVGLTLE